MKESGNADWINGIKSLAIRKSHECDITFLQSDRVTRTRVIGKIR